jgi:hypothetical protein
LPLARGERSTIGGSPSKDRAAPYPPPSTLQLPPNRSKSHRAAGPPFQATSDSRQAKAHTRWYGPAGQVPQRAEHAAGQPAGSLSLAYLWAPLIASRERLLTGKILAPRTGSPSLAASCFLGMRLPIPSSQTGSRCCRVWMNQVVLSAGGTVALSDHPVWLPPLRRSNLADHSHDRVVRVLLGGLRVRWASISLGFVGVFRLNATVPIVAAAPAY